jgi:hypothetical protein
VATGKRHNDLFSGGHKIPSRNKESMQQAAMYKVLKTGLPFSLFTIDLLNVSHFGEYAISLEATKMKSVQPFPGD